MSDIDKLDRLIKTLDQAIMTATVSSMDTQAFTGVYNHIVAARAIVNNVIRKEKQNDKSTNR